MGVLETRFNDLLARKLEHLRDLETRRDQGDVWLEPQVQGARREIGYLRKIIQMDAATHARESQ